MNLKEQTPQELLQARGSIRIQISDIYAHLLSLSRKQKHSDMEQQQIRAMERLIADNITRKDIIVTRLT